MFASRIWNTLMYVTNLDFFLQNWGLEQYVHVTLNNLYCSEYFVIFPLQEYYLNALPLWNNYFSTFNRTNFICCSTKSRRLMICIGLYNTGQEARNLKLTFIYRVSQEEWTKLRESVPYVKIYRYNPNHLYPKVERLRR